ncbi:MAG TPA: hypothetical protein VGQ51_16145 [Puia sp.]|jgi:hypothetical protein|nr:hypothetical protein [Puia sp.]
MKATVFPIHLPASLIEKKSCLIQSLTNWVRTREPIWEQNRLGIAAAGILIQVTFAGAMILILGEAGASPLIFTFGILMAFLADSLAFAQAPMRWLLAIFVLSSGVNLVLSIIYGLMLL